MAVNGAGEGRWDPLLPDPLILDELQKYGGPSAVPFTLSEIVVDGLPGELAFEFAPLATRSVQLEDGIKDAAEAMGTFSTSFDKIH